MIASRSSLTRIFSSVTRASTRLFSTATPSFNLPQHQAATMAAPKIIVLGGLHGQLGPALKKLAGLHAKNNFTMAILTGDVFTPTTDEAAISDLLSGSISVPLPTYFTVGAHPLPLSIEAKVRADEEICPNLHYLAKRSVTTTSDGIRIVALGGRLDTTSDGAQSKGMHLPFHTTADAKRLKGAANADILLTALWPSAVWSGSKTALQPAQQAAVESSNEIAELCATLRPRYHFSTSPQDFFYEREPMVHPANADDVPQLTRFISMAPYGNEAKAKAMYAFTLNKSDTTIPQGATTSPFARKKRPAEDAPYSRFGRSGEDRLRYPKRKRRNHSPPPGPNECYFCLSSPNINLHMCVSVGEDSYITTAKGPLPTRDTFKEQGLDFPGAAIIVPIDHQPTIASMGGSVTDLTSKASRTYAEMTRFREALQAAISAKSSHKLGVVTYEISLARNIHPIWQVIAFPAQDIRDGLVETAFRVEAENREFPALEARDLTLEEQATHGDYLRIWLWADDGEDKIKGKSLVLPLKEDQYFDLQFVRRVLAKLLRLEARFVWQDCAQTVEEETEDADALKAMFHDWDFTLEENA